MEPQSPDTQTVLWSVGGGLFGSAWVALSREMSRREVLFCLVGGCGFAAFIPPALCNWWGISQIYGGAIGFAGGVSVFAVFAGMQAFTSSWIKRKQDEISGPQTGGKS